MSDELTNLDENEEKQRKAAGDGGNGAADEEEATPLSSEELAALGSAAKDLMPDDSFLVGAPLRWSYETGNWWEELLEGRERVSVDIGEDEEFIVDVRSYRETYRRVEDSKVTHRLGGRRIDGWINCTRDKLPDQDKNRWPIGGKKSEPRDPWISSCQITLVRLADDKFFTWEAQYDAARGMSEFLDAACKEAGDHPGLMPVVTVESWQRQLSNGELRWVPRLRIIDWQKFGPGASPPANPRNLERIKQKLREINDELAPAAKAPGSKGRPQSGHSDMDDEIPF
jgi:hypothetical protein